MRNGRMVGEVTGEAMNEHAIVVLATGVTATEEGAAGMTQRSTRLRYCVATARIERRRRRAVPGTSAVCVLGACAIRDSSASTTSPT